jgi:hypothetical protein
MYKLTTVSYLLIIIIITNVNNHQIKAIEIPMHNLETIWKDFDASENARDKLLAKSLLPKLTPKYTAAKQAYRERKPITDNLLRNMLATPPGKGIISFEKKQVLHLFIILKIYYYNNYFGIICE